MKSVVKFLLTPNKVYEKIPTIRNCYVLNDKDYSVLKSYSTVVLIISKKINQVYLTNLNAFSYTTKRHITKFLGFSSYSEVKSKIDSKEYIIL